MSEGTRGIKQAAYQVLVASTPELLAKDKGDLWDSGKVESDQSFHIEYKGMALESGMPCFWKVRVWTCSALNPDLSTVALAKVEPRTLNTSSWSKPAMWSMGMLKPEDPPSPGSSGVTSWSAKWIRSQENDVTVAPWLRKTFELSAVPARASVCVNIAGYAELYVNGQKVGTDVLTPAVSDHNLQVFYNNVR
jgi:alpha-L-rhamnosidase